MEHNRISLIYYICDAMRASTESGTLNKNSVENNSGVEYSKRSRYDEYTSLVMQWSNSAGTKAGDAKIFYKNSGDYRLLKADGNGGYVEIARGTYMKVREIDERTFHESKKDFDRYVEERRNEQGRYSGDYEFYENGENDGQSDGRVDSKLSGNNIGGSNENSLSGDRRDSVKNQFSLRSYSDSEYLKAVKSGDTETALLWILQRKRVIKKKSAETLPWKNSPAKTVKKPSDTPEAGAGQTSVNSISKYNRIVNT